MYKILAINPGSTSTKVAVYHDDKPYLVESVKHDAAKLAEFGNFLEQYKFRSDFIRNFLASKGIDLTELAAVVGRGGTFKPLASGTYLVNETLKNDVHAGKVQADHVSNLGCLLAAEIAEPLGIPAFFVDPVSVDEFDDVARLSGHPLLPRNSLVHALNVKMVAKKFARQTGKPYERMCLVVAHLGGGISITSHRDGRMIDVNNANDEGPFSPQRCGTLPITGLSKLCFSGKFNASEMKDQLTKKGGVFAYLGTDDILEALNRADAGDAQAALVVEAMVYQIAKYIGAYAAVLDGDCEAILLTGGIAQSERLMNKLAAKVRWIAPVHVFPGEDEMEGLALGALRVLENEESAKTYA